MNKQHKIGAYIRVSTDKQVQIFEGSLDTQKFRMVEFVKNRNRESKHWGDIVEFYIEEGLSAGTVNRPEYQRMMTDIRKGNVDLVLVHDISRLNRSTHDFQILLKELERYGASYLSMKEQFDTTTPAGRLMMNMVVNMAQFEREQTSERVSINCHSRAVRGLVNGARSILGYDRHPEKNSVLVVNQEEAKDVRFIFETFLEQGSTFKALKIINEQKISPKIAVSEAAKGIEKEQWSHTALKVMLSNVAYIGLKEVNKKNKNEDQEFLKPWQRFQVVKASWPGIVPKMLFDQVQKVLEENAVLERRRMSEAEFRIFLFSQRLYCSECGSRLHGHSAHGRDGVYRHYTHAGKVEDMRCSFKRVRADKIEEIVVKHLTTTILQAGYLEKIEVGLAESIKAEPKELKERASKIQKAIAELDSEISSTFRMQSRLKDGTAAVQLAADRLEELAQKRKELHLQLLEVRARAEGAMEVRDVVSGIQDRILEFKKGFSKATPAVKRRLIRKVLGNLFYAPGKIGIEFNLSEQCAENVISINKSKNKGNGQILDVKGPPALPSRAAGSDLTLPFVNLRDGLDGWGSRTRTCE